MPFNIRTPIEMFVMDSEHDARISGTLDFSWKSYHFPTPLQLRKNRRYATQNLSMLKVMMAESDLINGKDYIFQGPSDSSEPIKSTNIGFRDEAEGLMMTMRWLASDWYRKQNS